MATQTAPTLADIEEARTRIAAHARVTPVYGSETLSRRIGRRVWLKAENLQRTGSFKIRGAVNKLSTLGEAQRAAGVLAASAGNHGQSVAWAARELGIGATVFMPQDAPMAKVEATRSYGAETVFAGATFDDAVAAALRYAQETGATFVHAFEDEAVIAGQGTIGLELAEQLPDAETFVVPIGGGGLAAGIAIALRALRPGVRLVGVQAGKSSRGTIADGIAVKHPGELTMAILGDLLDDVVHVENEELVEAIVLLLERSKLVVEGAGAASVAALLSGKAGGGDSGVCALLSGGNIDATLLISVMRHGLTAAGRYLVLRTRVPDRPGGLLKLLELVAELRGNILEVNHRREAVELDVSETGVELTVITRDEEHCAELRRALRDHGYPLES